LPISKGCGTDFCKAHGLRNELAKEASGEEEMGLSKEESPEKRMSQKTQEKREKRDTRR
jgi:hypothetical protein